MNEDRERVRRRDCETPCACQTEAEPKRPAFDIRRKYDRVNRLRWSHRRSGLKRY